MRTKPAPVMAALLFSFVVFFLSYWASIPETAFAQTQVKIAMVQTKSGWDNIQEVFRNLGKLKKDIDTAEGGFWTNKYLPR